MAKKDLVKKVQEKISEVLESKVSQETADKVLVSVLQSIVEEVKENDRVQLKDFGIFSKKERKGRERKQDRTIVIDKATGKTITIPAGKSEDKTILAFDSKVVY